MKSSKKEKKLKTVREISYGIANEEFRSQVLSLTPNAFQRLKRLTINNPVHRVFKHTNIRDMCFPSLETFKLNDANVCPISDCEFPQLKTLKIREYQTRNCVARCDFPQLKVVHFIGNAMEWFEDNNFGQKEMDEFVYETYDKGSHRDLVDLVPRVKSSKICGPASSYFSTAIYAVEDRNPDMESEYEEYPEDKPHPGVDPKSIQLEQLIIGDVGLPVLQEALNKVNLSMVTELVVFSIKPTGDSDYSITCAQRFKAGKNETVLDLRKLANLETVYVVNHNISKVINGPKLKYVIFSNLSPDDEFYNHLRSGSVISLKNLSNKQPFYGDLSYPDDKMLNFEELDSEILSKPFYDDARLPEMKKPYEYEPSIDTFYGTQFERAEAFDGPVNRGRIRWFCPRS
ncbi:hypothetical protein WICPIJ_004417 [Wickerhamomyces pijperi]|uniref:F-box domain-containing protein n=1 Tax=Wickerhamomyces pijperi TaxID=599730 RepID=A0A9P8Q5Z3_WICPI|nr:hypothetical protein WICPIJ_004417 [Wickerhamomyces pijperi]